MNATQVYVMLKKKIDSGPFGSPLVAASVAGMTDHDRVYVYTGDEDGYTSGNWYYWNGTAWTSGGVYNAAAVETDTTLTHSGEAADAKATGDAIDEVKGSLNDKANTDGSYESMTVGNAEQLVSTVFTDDKEPYNFRTAGGNADIGDRLYEKIVGGTVAWNQMIEDGDFPNNSSKWLDYKCTHEISNGVATVTPTEALSRIYQVKSVILNHKYLIMALYKGVGNGGSATLSWYGGVNKFVPLDGSWQTVAFVLNNSFQTNANWQIQYGVSGNENLDAYEIKNAMCFDLTAMFGSTIADYIYSLETANAGAGVAWFKKLFPKDYYAYDAGSLQSVQAAKHVTVGFNQWDETTFAAGVCLNSAGTDVSSNASYATIGTSTNKIRVLPGATYCVSVAGAVSSKYYSLFDKNGAIIGTRNYANASTLIAVPENAFYIRISVPYASATYNHDICINLHWDGERDGEYEPYVKHEYPLADITLRGIPKLDASNHLYYDGDTYESDGTVTRRYGIVDLGTLNWQDAGNNVYQAEISLGKAADNIGMVTNAPYTQIPKGQTATDKIFKSTLTGGKQIVYFRNDSVSTVSAFVETVNGKYLVYELATPTTESADPFQSPQVVDDFGTEEYVDAGVTASPPTRDVAIPVGHESQYSANLRAKLEMAPDSPSDGDGDYLVRQTSGENEYVKYVSPVPTLPSEDGTYSLKVTVSGGTKTLSWVADT